MNRTDHHETELDALLAAERPEPDDEAKARIDQRVESVMAPPEPAAGAHGVLARLRGVARDLWDHPSRLALPAGAAATLAIGVVVGVGQLDEETPSAPARGNGPAQEDSKDAVVSSALTVESAGEVSADAPPGVSQYGLDAPRLRIGGSGIAPNQQNRKVERSARLTLSGDPDEVREMADRVVSVTDRLGGIVVSANVSEQPGSAESSHADIEIAVPVTKLDDALAQLSEIGSVEFREQSDVDVTAQAVSARTALRNARETRNALRAQLENATDPEQIAELDRQIRRAEQRVARHKAAVARIGNRTSFARIGVQIVANGHGSDGEWSIGDAVDDAIEALETIAGIAIVTAAILFPLTAAIALLAWLIARMRKHQRESALDRGESG